MAEQDRHAHAKQKQPKRLFLAAFPKRNDGPDGGDEENGIQQAKFRTNEISKIFQSWMPLMVHAGVIADVVDGDPTVPGIPDDERQREKAEEEQGEPGS